MYLEKLTISTNFTVYLNLFCKKLAMTILITFMMSLQKDEIHIVVLQILK